MRIFQCPPEHCSRAMLTECGLPTSDLEARHFEHFLGCGTAEDLKGVIGIELFGSVALLRSLVVIKEVRGSGYGKALVAGAEEYAREKGVRELYLLTTTAADFFDRLGYSVADRKTAPRQIGRTKEFSDLCPDSAVFMVKKLYA